MKTPSALALCILLSIFGVAVADNKTPDVAIKLYYSLPSVPCRAVVMTTRVMDLNVELIETNILEGDNKKPEYLKMNPQHTIPTINDNGFILWESRAIMAYFVNAYGKDDSLYPTEPKSRAIVDLRLNFDIGTLYPRFSALYYPMVFHQSDFDQEKADKLNEALGWMDTFLDGHDFVAGDHLTIADISIIATFSNLDAFGFDFTAYKNVQKWLERTKKELEPYGYNEINEAGAQILLESMKRE